MEIIRSLVPVEPVFHHRWAQLVGVSHCVVCFQVEDLRDAVLKLAAADKLRSQGFLRSEQSLPKTNKRGDYSASMRTHATPSHTTDHKPETLFLGERLSCCHCLYVHASPITSFTA